MAQVDFTVTISGGGAGIGVFIKVDDQTLHFATSSTQSLQLDPADYIAAVSGAEPSDSTVNIQIIEAGTLLRSSDFSESSFWGLMAFTVF